MMTKALALNGAHRVYILGRSLSKLQDAAKESPHGNIIPIETDVTSKPSLAAAAAQVAKEVGHINLLIANAGYAGATLERAPDKMDLVAFKDFCWNLDPNEFNRTYEVNLTAVFFTTIAFLDLLDRGNKAQNYPSITSQVIITSSIAGFLKKAPTVFAYTSSKAGATHMGRNLGAYLAPYQIRVNVIAPGIFPTELAKGLTEKYPDGPSREAIPAGRFGTDEDMAGTLLYLASRAGAFTDGCTIVLDGGRVKIAPSAY